MILQWILSLTSAYKGWAIVAVGAIYAVVKAYDAIIESVEEVDEKSKTLLNEYNSAMEKVNSNGKTIDDISEKYETLSKGVDDLGRNISLTTEEYEEYNSIANQIADMFPSLIKGYTDEGNAILSLKGNVNELRDAYKEAQQEAYNLLIVGGEDSDGNDIISNYQNQINGNESFLSTTSSYINGKGGAVDAIDIISRLTGALTPEEFRETYDELYKEYENIWNSDKIQDALKSSGFKELTSSDKWSEITTKDLEKVKHSAQATIQTYKAEIDSHLKDVQTLANAYLMTNEDYEKLDEEAKNAASVIVNTINENIVNGFNTKEDVGAYVSSLLESILEYPELQDDLIGLFTTDYSDKTVQEAAIAVNEYIGRIAEILGEDSTELKIRLGFDNYDELYEKYSNIVTFTNDKFENFNADDKLVAIKEAQQALQDEYNKIKDWGLEDYSDDIKNGTIQSVFGNVDMDKRTIIEWSDELKKTYQEELASWDYDPEVGGIDTVFGGSDRFGEDINGTGWEVAFTPILPDGTFLSKDAVYDYINNILVEAYSDDGKVTEDELMKIDAQGRQVGNTFVQGIFAGIDESQEYENNGNWAEVVGRLMHFSGDYGAVNIAENAIEDAKKLEPDFDWNTWFTENSINTKEELDRWLEIAKATNDAAEARKKYLQDDTGLFSSFEGSEIGSRLQYLTSKFKEGALSHKEYFDSLQNEINDVDFTQYTDSIEEANAAMQQFFTDSVQQTASGLSGLINKFDSGKMSITEYLEGYLSIANTLSTLTDSLQENSDEWNKNGEAINNATNNALDNTQSSLESAISVIETYQDSIYSMEEILGGTLEVGSDEFTAHANVVAQDLANIVATGGEMADEVSRYLGTTTEEIAKSMTENVDNQSVAAQAIAANTNVAISDMATAIGDLFKNLGDAISNFKVDISFGIKSISTEAVDMGLLGVHELPKINFSLEANGDSLATIGAAISSFGETVSANIATQQIELPDFNIDAEDEYTPDADVLKNYNDELDRLKDSSKGAADATDKLTDALEKEKEALEDLKNEYDELYDAIQWFYDQQIDKIDKKIDALNDENEALEKQQENMDKILAAIESNYDAEIKLIQDKIDALQDENDEEERALALEEAKRKLQEAKSRKTLMVYQKGVGFTYQVDTKAITEAEEELEELQENEVVAELEKQIEKLEEAKEKWSEIPDAYEKAMQEIAAMNYFGKNWKDITLNPSDELLNSFEGKYTGIQSSIAKNEDRIESYEKEKEKIEELKQAWEDAKNAYQYSQYESKLASFFGSDYEYQLLHNSASWRRKFADEYSSICSQIEALEERIKGSNESTASSTEASADRVAGAAGKVKEATKDLKFEIDTDVLTTAKEKLEQLDLQISLGQKGLQGVRDAVAEFISNYEKADGCTTLTKELTDSVEVLKGMYEGTGSSMEGAMSKVTSDIETFKVQSQTMSQNLTDVDEKLQSINNSESQVESNVNAELSEVDQTILNLKKNIDDLKLALQELETFKTSLNTLVTDQVLDTSVLTADTMARVTEIQTAVSALFVSIGTLGNALETLSVQMQTLDSYTLNNLIMSLGQGGEEGGSGLFAAIQNIITLISNEETGLLALLGRVNTSDLTAIIASFNGEAGLLPAITAVSNAIFVEGDEDGVSLYSVINKLIETIPTITSVRSSFSELVGTLAVCNSQVNSLQKAIDELPTEKTITINVVQNGTIPEGTGTAFAYGTGTANNVQSGNAYSRGTWGLPTDQPDSLVGELGTEIVVRDGQYFTVDSPTIMDLEKDDIVFNHKQTKEILKNGKKSVIDKLANQSKSVYTKLTGSAFAKGTMNENVFNAIMHGLQFAMNPVDMMPKFAHGINSMPEARNEQNFNVTIGDIYLNGVQDTNGLARAIKDKLPRLMVQELSKR